MFLDEDEDHESDVGGHAKTAQHEDNGRLGLSPRRTLEPSGAVGHVPGGPTAVAQVRPDHSHR